MELAIHFILQQLSIILTINNVLECTCWSLGASPSSRCVVPESIILVNCLNFTDEGNRIFPHNVQWFKLLDSGALDPIMNSPTDRVRSDRHQLRFNGTQPIDDSLYCCKSHTNTIERGCTQMATFNLSIALPPIIVQNKINQLVLAGDTVHLECVLSYMGMPAASTLKWQRFGKDIVQDPIYSITQSSNSINLTINNVTTADEGAYNCVVENSKQQTDNKTVYLSVQSSDDAVNDTADCGTNIYYTITAGLRLKTTHNTTTLTSTTAECNLLQENAVQLQEAIHKFLASSCSCHGFCVSMDGIDCSGDSSIATVVFTLRGKDAMSLQDQTYSALQNESAIIDYLGTNYSLVCIVSTFCPEVTTVNATMAETDTNSKRYTTEIALGISAVLIALVFSVTIAVILWFVKSHKKDSLDLTIDDLHSCDNQSHHNESNIYTDYNSAVSCENCNSTSISPATHGRMSNELELLHQLPSRQFPDSSTSCHPANKWSENQSRPVYNPFDTRQTFYSNHERSYDANVMPQVHNSSDVMPHFFSNFTTDV